MSNDWLQLGIVSPTQLVGARLELHWALQAPAALGIARAQPTPDHAQHALAWMPRHAALVGPLAGVSAGTHGKPARAYRAGLRLEEPALILLDAADERREDLPLAGRTVSEACAWLDEASARLSGTRPEPLVLPEHELPDHPLAGGARFARGGAAHAEIARWFGNLAETLERLRAGRAASPLRLWSHHFDLDTVLALGNERTRGLGFSPGDEGCAEPYLYVLPVPEPDPSALPLLPAPFEWSTEDWVGAVLRGSRLAALPAADQARMAERFYRVASEALDGLLPA